MGKPSRKLKKTLWIIGVTGAVYLSFRYLLPLVIPFLLAYGMALLLKPSAGWLSKKVRITIGGKSIGLSIGAAGALELLLLLFLLGMGIYFGGQKLYEEAGLLIERTSGSGRKGGYLADGTLSPDGRTVSHQKKWNGRHGEGNAVWTGVFCENGCNAVSVCQFYDHFSVLYTMCSICGDPDCGNHAITAGDGGMESKEGTFHIPERICSDQPPSVHDSQCLFKDPGNHHGADHAHLCRRIFPAWKSLLYSGEGSESGFWMHPPYLAPELC